MPCRQQAARTVLFIDGLRLFRGIPAGRIDTCSLLEILDVKVVAQTEPNRLLLLLVGRLPQKRMRCERLDRIDFRRIRIGDARRKHVTHTRKPPDFRHPDTIKFRVGSQAVVVIVSHVTIRTFARIKTHVALSLVQRIIRITPGRSSPIPRERSPRSNIDNVKKPSRIIQCIGSGIPHIMSRRILVLQEVLVTAHVIVKTVRKAVVELFEERLERSVFCGHLAFFQLKIEKVPAHAVLDIGQVAFEHPRREVMVLRNPDRQALVVPEFS